MKKVYFILLVFIILSCNKIDRRSESSDMNAIAAEYVKLVFQAAQYDKDLVDAYFGPEELKAEALENKITPEEIQKNIDNLLFQISNLNSKSYSSLELSRKSYLYRMLKSMKARIDLVKGKKMSFDQESKLIYDIVAPRSCNKGYKKYLKKLSKILPGKGSVKERYMKLREQFIIPEDKMDAVFTAAINECRKRTKDCITLPHNEEFTVEYVKDVSWGAYNWFKGNSHSLIQVNISNPMTIDDAIRLAAHEGYPGHHVYHSLMEQNLYKEMNWVEFSIYPLFSPQSFISEGLANYGVELVFDDEDKIHFEKDILIPLAGLSNENYDIFCKAQDIIEDLSEFGIDIARDYLDGKSDKEETIKKIMETRLRTREHAQRNLDFYEKYRAYIINYSLGEDVVEDYIEQKSAQGDHNALWANFYHLLVTPTIPANLDTYK